MTLRAEGNVVRHAHTAVPVAVPCPAGDELAPLPLPRMTVLRVKRRREEDPLDSVVVEGTAKALRTEQPTTTETLLAPETSSLPETRIFRRLVTVEADDVGSTTRSKGEDAVTLHRRLFALVRKARYSKKSSDDGGTLHAARKQISQEKWHQHATAARLKILSQRRQQSSPTAASSATEPLRIVDLEQEPATSAAPTPPARPAPRTPAVSRAQPTTIMLNKTPLVRQFVPVVPSSSTAHGATRDNDSNESDDNSDGDTTNANANKKGAADFVYDMYYLAETATAGAAVHNLGRSTAVVQYESFDEDLLFDEEDEEAWLRNGGQGEYDDEGEDSNAEEYYRNDYPDEDAFDDSDVFDEEMDEEETDASDNEDDGVVTAHNPFMPGGGHRPTSRSRKMDIDDVNDDDDDDGDDDDDDGDDDSGSDGGSESDERYPPKARPKHAAHPDHAAYSGLSASARALLRALRASVAEAERTKHGSKNGVNGDGSDNDGNDGDGLGMDQDAACSSDEDDEMDVYAHTDPHRLPPQYSQYVVDD